MARTGCCGWGSHGTNRMASVGHDYADLFWDAESGVMLATTMLSRLCFASRPRSVAVDMGIGWQLPWMELFLFGTFNRIVLWSSCEQSIRVISQSTRCA